MAVRASSVDVRLRLRGQRQFKKEVASSTATLEAMGLRGAKALGAFALQSDKLKNFGRSWTRNVSIPVALGAGLAVKAAIDWEDAFAGVKKTIDATPAQFKALETGLRSMSTQIPVAATELAEIAEAAGQLGIKRSAILGFTRTVADLGVATNLAGEEGASTLARFANITQMPQSQFDRLGSTIVALGNAGASTEKDIAAMGLRLAAAGNFVGMSEPQILAFANALSSVGIEAEAGGTAMSKVFKTLNSAVSAGGEELENFAAVSGLSSGAFAKAWKADAATATVAWIEGIARLEKEGKDVPKLLYNLSPKLRGDRVQDAIQRASGAGALLRESLGLGVKSWKENNALTQEASKRYQTVKSKLQILKNQVIDAGVSLGQQLLPPLVELVEFAGPKITAVAEAFGALPGPVKAAAIGLLILTGPVATGLGFLAGGLGRTIVGLAKLMQFASGFRALAAGVGTLNALKIALAGFGLTLRGLMMTTGIGLAITALILLDQHFHFLGPTIAWIKGALGDAFAWISTAAGNVLDWLKSNWKTVLILLSGPIGWAVAAIVKHWGTIKNAVSGAASTVLGFLKANWPLILGVLTGPLGLAVALVIRHWSAIKGAVVGAANTVIGWLRRHWKTIAAVLGGPFGLAVKFVLDHWGTIKSAASAGVHFVLGKLNALMGFVTGMPGRLANAGRGVFNFLKESFRGAVNWIIDAWNGLEFRIPGFDPPGPGPEFGGFTLGMPDIPRLAMGGNIVAPGVVEVGEKGPELLQLPRAARVTPLDPAPIDLRRAMGGRRHPIRVPVYLRDKQIAEATAEISEDEAAYGA